MERDAWVYPKKTIIKSVAIVLRRLSVPSSGHTRCPRHLYDNFQGIQPRTQAAAYPRTELLQQLYLVLRVTARQRHATGYARPCLEVPRARGPTPALQVTGDICTVVAGVIYKVVYLHQNLPRGWYMEGRCLVLAIKAIQGLSTYCTNKVTEYCVPRKPVA